ncbi:MAG TPA: TonB-dependent receptor [Nevskiaceae bacterium]|nr:TonB-dependent receptor [Nevskiaceae bacterium]
MGTACLLLACAAQAQDAGTTGAQPPPVIPVAAPAEAAPQAAGDKTGDAVQLGDVVVTATKREKSLREVPASIRELDGRDLEAKAVLSINELLDSTPGVTSNSTRPGEERIIMRGISTTASGTTVAPYPVGVFVGDTSFNEPYAASITPDLSAFDLAGVDILKGPQGTLFGGAALAGAIRYRLNDPLTDQWQLRAFSQFTNLEHGSNALTEGVVVNAPLRVEDGGLGARLVYIDRQYPGSIDWTRPDPPQRDANQGRGEQFRGSLLWTPTDAARLQFTYLEQDYSAANDIIVADGPYGPRSSSASLQPWPNQHRFALYQLGGQYDFEHVRIVSSTSRTEKKRYNSIESLGALLGSPPGGTPAALALPFITHQDSTSFSQELRVQSIDTPLEWLVGGYYYHAPINYELVLNVQALQDLGGQANNLAPLLAQLRQAYGALYGANNELNTLLGQLDSVTGNPGCELSVLCAETHAKATEKALFFDLSRKFWQRLELEAGARLYRTEVNGGFVGTGAGARLVNNGMSPVYVLNDLVEQGINPKFTATLHFTRDISTYFQAARGFRFGGIQQIPADKVQNVPGTFKSDSLWNYELGLRTAWLGNTLHADVTGFHIDYKNPQVQLKDLEELNYYDNVGAAVSNGVEGSLEWLTPLTGIALSATGGYTNAHTTEPFKAGNTPVPAGVPLPGSAKVQYSGQLTYLWPYGGDYSWGGALSYVYVGKTSPGLQVSQYVYDFGVVNFSSQFGAPGWPGKPSLALSIENLADRTAPVSIIGSATGSSYYLLTPPRTYTARLTVEFD